MENLSAQLAATVTSAHEAVRAYGAALTMYGVEVTPLLADASLKKVLSWLHGNIQTLGDFIGGVGDFAVLATILNMSKILGKGGVSTLTSSEKRRPSTVLLRLVRLGSPYSPW